MSLDHLASYHKITISAHGHLTQLCMSRMGTEEQRGPGTLLESHSDCVSSEPDFPSRNGSFQSLPPTPVPTSGALFSVAHKPGVMLRARSEVLAGRSQHREKQGSYMRELASWQRCRWYRVPCAPLHIVGSGSELTSPAAWARQGLADTTT